MSLNKKLKDSNIKTKLKASVSLLQIRLETGMSECQTPDLYDKQFNPFI